MQKLPRRHAEHRPQFLDVEGEEITLEAAELEEDIAVFELVKKQWD